VRLGVTIGDPCGIGPEVVTRALAQAPLDAEVHVFGDAGVLERAGGVPRDVHLHAVTTLDPVDSCPGQPTGRSGRAQIEYLEAAVALARACGLDALATAPISKRSAYQVGFRFAGHTDYLGDALGVADPVMMLAGPRLRVSLATVHIPLAAVPGRLDPAAIARTITLTAGALHSDFGVARPRVAVCGLNPHAGEGGALGQEETLIAAAIGQAADPQASITGPHVPDVVFRQAASGQFDAVVAMYHDQGLIPAKLLDFDETVNVTLGLPIVRTSPDHGSAYDLAGTGRANPRSMRRALELAVELATRRRQ
jgi:4-hydroxythreonine-4-phosphate dehydrogenase